MSSEKIFEIVHPETGRRYKIKNIQVACQESLRYVEFTVVGNYREYLMWAEFDSFYRMNPDLEILEEWRSN